LLAQSLCHAPRKRGIQYICALMRVWIARFRGR